MVRTQPCQLGEGRERDVVSHTLLDIRRHPLLLPARKAIHMLAEPSTHMTTSAAHMTAASTAACLGISCKRASSQQGAREDHHRSPLHNIILSLELYVRSVGSAAVS